MAMSGDTAAGPPAGYNLVGQKLGRKGLETRERVICSALRLLKGPADMPITLTSVAREASVGMTTLYLYFPNLGELLLAAFWRVMEAANTAYLDRLRMRWPDAGLEDHCRDFLQAHYRFWRENAHILHMCNGFTDTSDLRFLDCRSRACMPLIALLVQQMDADPAKQDSAFSRMAAVLLTGLERLTTWMVTPYFDVLADQQGILDRADFIDQMIAAEAELMCLVLRDKRSAANASLN